MNLGWKDGGLTIYPWAKSISDYLRSELGFYLYNIATLFYIILLSYVEQDTSFEESFLENQTHTIYESHTTRL